MKYVYLAGPIRGIPYGEAENWRTKATEALAWHAIGALSPLRGKEYLAAYERMPNTHDSPLATAKAIVTRDRWDCQRADVVLVNLLGASAVSISTMVELGWADSARVPIVVAIEDASNVHEHSFVRELAGFVAPTLDGAIAIVVGLLAE